MDDVKADEPKVNLVAVKYVGGAGAPDEDGTELFGFKVGKIGSTIKVDPAHPQYLILSGHPWFEVQQKAAPAEPATATTTQTAPPEHDPRDVNAFDSNADATPTDPADAQTTTTRRRRGAAATPEGSA